MDDFTRSDRCAGCKHWFVIALLSNDNGREQIWGRKRSEDDALEKAAWIVQQESTVTIEIPEAV